MWKFFIKSNTIRLHGCQMAIAGFLESYVFCPSGFSTMAPLHCAAKFDPFLSLDCAPTPSTLAQSKERKGSNFAIWQPCCSPPGESCVVLLDLAEPEPPVAHLQVVHPQAALELLVVADPLNLQLSRSAGTGTSIPIPLSGVCIGFIYNAANPIVRYVVLRLFS